MATPGRRRAHRAPRTRLADLASLKPRPRTTGRRSLPQETRTSPVSRSVARRPATLAALLVASVATVAASAPQALTSTAADAGTEQARVLYSAPSLEQQIEERREASVSRSSERAALPEQADEVVAGTAEATAEPEEEPEGTTDGDGESADSPSGSISDGACASGSDVESGLVSAAIAVHRAVCAEFPSVTSYGGVRSGDGGEHGTGHALDIMVSGSTGDAIADFVRAHAYELGVTEVIWSQRIWTTQRASEGWRSMEDRGSTTANHYDHVHVTVG